MEIVKVTFSLGALGLRKIAENEKASNVLKYGLSFISNDDDALESILEDNAEIMKQLEEVIKG